ncbi:MAG TPA: hypothetical protein VIU16_01605 [Gaiellaceae bacterium]|jgi:hypothetical protein
MMIRYFELHGIVFRRLDTGFDLRTERFDPETHEWVDDPSFIHFLAEGAPGAVQVDEARAAELTAVAV